MGLKARRERTLESVPIKTKYAFGDTDIAARRLELLARVFEHSTRAFLREASATRLGLAHNLAIDLGCGPGFTTHLIGETLGFNRVVGLETSQRFIELARATVSARISFELHDVCAVPFPAGPADTIFCRFLVTHLADPADALAKWATQLNPGGLLMLEEVERIETVHPILRSYVGIVETMLQRQSNTLYPGPLIAKLDVPNGLQKLMSEVRRIAVTNARAADLFRLNMQVWKERAFISENNSEETIRDLESALEAIARERGTTSYIAWGMRQVIFRRA
jgi:SAM-dependent methyltransferase